MSGKRPPPEFFGFAGMPRPCQIPPAVKTIFEKIRDGEIPADVIHRDEHCFAFRDISPQAPFHVLIVPNKPIPRIGEAEPGDQAILGHLLLTAAKIALSCETPCELFPQEFTPHGVRQGVAVGPHVVPKLSEGGQVVLEAAHVSALEVRDRSW